jgi:hypothetical protein
MDQESFEKLKKHTIDKLRLTEETLEQQSLRIPQVYQNYLTLYIEEIKTYKDLLSEKDKLYGVLFNDMKFNTNKELKTKSEIEPFIWANEGYYKMCLRINDQEIQVKYLEETLSTLKNMSYHISNAITLIKIRKGII